jgi:hypothetical protein
VRRAASFVLAAVLTASAGAASAHGHAWSPPQTVGQASIRGDHVTTQTPMLRAAASVSGHLALAWLSMEAERDALYVVRAAPGEPFGPAELIATSPRRHDDWQALRLSEVVVSETGTVGLLFGDIAANPGGRLGIASPGAAFDTGGLPSWSSSMAADAGGSILTAGLVGEDMVAVRRWSTPVSSEHVATVAIPGSTPSLAVAGGDIVVASTRYEGPTVVAWLDRVGGAERDRQTVPGIQARVRAGAGGHLILQANEFQRVLTASAAPGARLSSVQDVSERRIVFPQQHLIAPDGTVAVSWGGFEWVDTWEKTPLALGPAGSGLRRVPESPVAGRMGWGVRPLGFDGASRLVAMGRHVSGGYGHPYVDGRVAFAARIGGRWCYPEVVSEAAPDNRFGELAFDGESGGVAAWRDAASGDVRLSRYAARADCRRHR